MKELAYFDGEISESATLKVPFDDRARFFGDGVYEAAIARNYHIFQLDDHLDRLFRSLALIDIEPNFDRLEIESLLNELSKKVDLDNQFIYFQVSRGVAPRNHDYDIKLKPTVSIVIREGFDVLGQLYQPVAVQLEEDIRFAMCHVKTLNLLPNVLSTHRANKKGLFETIYHRNGRVTECAHSNVHILKDGVLQTAPTNQYILPGVTRKLLLENCHLMGIPVREEAFSTDDLFSADEVIITATADLCIQVNQIDGVAVGGKAPQLLKKLQDKMYQDYLKETE